jgi:hypothetical protein
MKTIEVRALVREVLDTLPVPYTEHVIDDVLHAIETSPRWLGEYHRLCDRLGTHVVNTRCGYWIANALDKTGEVQVPSRRNGLTASYSLLDTDGAARRRPKEPEARELMAGHYRENRDRLPPVVREYREEIVELIMSGMSAEQAFAFVLSGHAAPRTGQ